MLNIGKDQNNTQFLPRRSILAFLLNFFNIKITCVPISIPNTRGNKISPRLKSKVQIIIFVSKFTCHC